MKIRLSPASILLVLLALAVFPLRADIISMKDGKTVYEGKILQETVDTIRVEYNLTPKIKDTKVLQKADILSIKKQTQSETEIEQRGLRKLLPSADLLTAADYESIIQDKLRPFVSRFPGTPETAEVEKIIASLIEEKAKVSAGELKVEGKWLNVATAKRDSYNIEAYALRQQMKLKALEPNDLRYANALRLFEQLATKYPASLQYVEAIAEAAEYLNLYDKQLTAMILAQPKLAADRAAGLKALTGSEATLTGNAIKKEVEDFNAKVAEQSKTKNFTWFDIYPYDLSGLKSAQAAVFKAKAEMAKLDLEKLRNDNVGFMAVIRAIAEGNISAAEGALVRLPKPASGSPPAMVVAWRKQIEDLRKKEAASKALAVKESTVEGAAPTDASTSPDGTNPLAEELKKLEEKKRAQKSEADKKKADADKKKAARDALNMKPEEEEGFFAQYGLYVGAGLAVLLLGVFIYSKMRGDKEE